MKREAVPRASRRALGVPKSGIRELFNLAATVRDAVSFTLGEPDFATPPHIVEAAKKALDEGYTHYTSNAGLLELREAVAAKLRRENGIDVDPKTGVLATVGGMGGLSLAILSTVNPGDEVLLPDPGWPNYEAQVRLAEAVPVPVPVREENGFRLLPEDLEPKISGKTRMILLNTPANPTGSVLERRDLERIAGIAQQYDLLVLVDEVYEKILYDGARHYSIGSLRGMKERTITVNSLSKTYAMTGWRIGYAAGPEEIVAEMVKLQEDISGHPSAAVQVAAVAALTGPQRCVQEMVAEYAARREIIVEGLNAIEGITCTKPRGAFYAFPSISQLGASSMAVSRYMISEGRVVVVPGTAFGNYGEGYLRLSFATSRENIRLGLARIETAARNLLKNKA